MLSIGMARRMRKRGATRLRRGRRRAPTLRRSVGGLKKRVRRLEGAIETKMLVYADDNNSIPGYISTNSKMHPWAINGGQLYHGTYGGTSGNKWMHLSGMTKGDGQGQRTGDEVYWTHCDIKIGMVAGKDVFVAPHLKWALVKYWDYQGTDYDADMMLSDLYGTAHPRPHYVSNYLNEQGEWKRKWKILKSGSIKHHLSNTESRMYYGDNFYVRKYHIPLGFKTEYYRDKNFGDHRDVKHNAIVLIVWTEDMDIVGVGGGNIASVGPSSDGLRAHFSGYFFYKDA